MADSNLDQNEEEVEISLTVLNADKDIHPFRYISQRESLYQIWFTFKTPDGVYQIAVQKYSVDSKGACHKLKKVHFFEQVNSEEGSLRAIPIYDNQYPTRNS